MTDLLSSTAHVPTDAAARYAKQLASHLGRRAEVREEADGTRLVLSGGECLLRPHEGELELLATAGSPEDLDRVTDVVARHLVRFGQRNELEVTWTT